MIAFNSEYDRLTKELSELKKKYCETIIPFGKYAGKTIGYVHKHDKQYLYWLIRESNLDIELNVLGLAIPSLDDVIRLIEKERKNNSRESKVTIVDNKFKVDEKEYIPAVYDNWNVGHYGCCEPKVVKQASVSESTMYYSIADIIKYYGEHLSSSWPFINWTEDFLVKLMNDYKQPNLVSLKDIF